MITIEELDKLMKKMFLSSQLNKIGWNDLSDDDKSVALDNAIDEINELPFIGEKAEKEQEFAFPRIFEDEIIGIDCGVDKALAQYCFDFVRINNNETIANIEAGISSVKVEGASESYNINQIDRTSINTNFKKYLSGLIYRGV